MIERIKCGSCKGTIVFVDGGRVEDDQSDTCSCKEFKQMDCNDCGQIPHAWDCKDIQESKDTKETNPKDAVGIAKVPISVISAPVIAELGLAMLEGARKYGRHNWRAAKARASVYYDATWRHLAIWWEGEDDDPDSGLNHITKAIASLMVLRDAMIQDMWIDDRPPVSPKDWMKKYNDLAALIIAKYPEAKDAITEIGNGQRTK